ncbi:hypothetical protein TNCV_45401 [Trichonephila clavipes]|nr:hypothetical protein TNCV_45401 [Trichonephila clavipes]
MARKRAENREGSLGFPGVSPNVMYKLGGEVDNILRSHNYIGKHEWKRNPNEIKRHKDSSDAPERTSDDSVAASLDIPPHTTEQQHVHFHWLGRR